MNITTKEQVIRLLEDYPEMQRKISLLRYEMEHPQGISADEMIEAMNFAKGEGIGSAAGSVSNKTLYIALNYRQKADHLNSECMDEIVQRLVPLENKQNRLRFYVGMLEDKQQEIIRLYYFEQRSWRDIASMTATSVRRLRDHRDAALEKLAQMYDFVGGIDTTK